MAEPRAEPPDDLAAFHSSSSSLSARNKAGRILGARPSELESALTSATAADPPLRRLSSDGASNAASSASTAGGGKKSKGGGIGASFRSNLHLPSGFGGSKGSYGGSGHHGGGGTTEGGPPVPQQRRGTPWPKWVSSIWKAGSRKEEGRSRSDGKDRSERRSTAPASSTVAAAAAAAAAAKSSSGRFAKAKSKDEVESPPAAVGFAESAPPAPSPGAQDPFPHHTKFAGWIDLRSSVHQRRMTRRTRNSVCVHGVPNLPFPFNNSLGSSAGSRAGGSGGLGRSAASQIRAQVRLKEQEAVEAQRREEDSLQSLVTKSLEDERLCDVELEGKDGVPVEVPGYLLALHSSVFKDALYPEEEDDDDDDEVAENAINAMMSLASESEEKEIQRESDGKAEKEKDESASESDADENEGSEEEDDEPSRRRKLAIPFADYDDLSAMVSFLATRTLPEGLQKIDDERCLRSICRIYLLGRMFKMSGLAERAYGAARRMMNKCPRLVCAAFDECMGSGRVEDDRWGRWEKPTTGKDEVKEYALEYMRESPMKTILARGTVYLNAAAIEEIICDQDMDVEEQTMFQILNTWVKQDEEDNRETARVLVSHINLSYLKTDYLNNVVRKCGFVEASDVNAALKEIEDMLENQSPDEKEHVVVEGAGDDKINGIYAKMSEDIGLGEEEVMYVKEADEDDYGVDYGLYLLRSTWHITSCIDYSSVLYSCEVPMDRTTLRHQPPESGWEAVGAAEPAPTCAWNPAKDQSKAAKKSYVAPNLDNRGVVTSSIVDVSNGDHDEGEGRKRYTLRTMLNLPTDEDFEDKDYHDDQDSGLDCSGKSR